MTLLLLLCCAVADPAAGLWSLGYSYDADEGACTSADLETNLVGAALDEPEVVPYNGDSTSESREGSVEVSGDEASLAWDGDLYLGFRRGSGWTFTWYVAYGWALEYSEYDWWLVQDMHYAYALTMYVEFDGDSAAGEGTLSDTANSKISEPDHWSLSESMGSLGVPGAGGEDVQNTPSGTECEGDCWLVYQRRCEVPVSVSGERL